MPDLSKTDKSKSSGVKYEYLPAVETTQSDNQTTDVKSENLEDLMSKLKSL